MFCTACGAAAQAGQRFCSQCGQSIDGASTPKHTNRVRDHLRILGILWMVYSIVIFLSGAALFVITKTALGHYGTFGEGMPHPHFLRPLMSLIAFFVTAKGLAGMAAGCAGHYSGAGFSFPAKSSVRNCAGNLLDLGAFIAGCRSTISELVLRGIS